MFYRVTADLAFTKEDEARDFYHDCELAILKSALINPDQDNQESGYICLEECHHDENPTEPCKVLKEQQLKP